MREAQRAAALQSMSEWLAHPQELGAMPAEIEIAGEFELHDMHYYTFRYRREAGGDWLLGVCGGYEEDGLEHCGHVYSEMKPYDPATAQEQATAMVEMVRRYWMEQAEKAQQAQEEQPEGGPFVVFVLLREPAWDCDKLVADLAARWDIRVEENARDSQGENLIFERDGMLATVALMPGPVPDGEAEHNAATNYLWREAVEVARAHTAHLMVAVLPRENRLVDAGKLLVQLCDACLLQDAATAVYVGGTVHQPEFYHDAAGVMRGGDLPYLNWIYLGLAHGSAGRICGYTYGMTCFGKEEIEVIDSEADPQELRGFLLDIAAYVIGQDTVLMDGQTIGFSAEQKLPITRSPGVRLEGMTTKIGFKTGETA